MNGFPIVWIVAIVLLIGIGYLYQRRKKAWSTVYEGAELNERASDQFAILQDDGVRCRMRNIPLHSNANAGFVSQGSAEPASYKVVIEIHRDDLEKAKQLLEQRVNGHYEFEIRNT